MSRRRQARRGNGRFTRNTMENTLGLHCAVCPHPDCRRLNPSSVGMPRPTHCHACGTDLTLTADERDGGARFEAQQNKDIDY